MTKCHLKNGTVTGRTMHARRWLRAAGLLLALLLIAAPLAHAQQPALERRKGAVTGFPVPRFVSLKSDEVNVRAGPGYDHAVAWVFRRAGLAVEVIGEFDVWRQIRDSEGASGWVSASLLSGRRTGVVAPWAQPGSLFELKDDDDDDAGKRASVERGAVLDIVGCDGEWCEVYAGTLRGYMMQKDLWGVYPREVIR